MKLSFKRITSSGSFIPEIDGLRFIAIVSVLFFHLSAFISTKDFHQYVDGVDYSWLKNLLSHGHLGVPLFFVISGFILGMPFAKYHLDKGKKVNIKNYFLRRLTRLEPPYMLVMTILLFGAVYVAGTLSLQEGLYSYLSSIIYCHNIIYPGTQPFLNAPAWSLEVEVQFYILAPLMAYFFTIKSFIKRRVVLFSASLLFLMLNYCISFKAISLFSYIQYFLIGFLLADLYVCKAQLLPKTKIDFLIGFFFFSVIWMYDTSDFSTVSHKFIWETIQLLSIFFLYYYVLFHKIFKLLSFRVITNIGGMCYTIYLLHYPIISMFGNRLLSYTFSSNSFVNVSVYVILLLSLIMTASSVFFLLVERPCMDKDWYKKFFKSKKDTVQVP